MRMEPKFDKGNEIYFRLGIIYKQQGKYNLSLDCFKYILGAPPKPLSEMDIWFQIGHVHEQQQEVPLALSYFVNLFISYLLIRFL
jgi:general transcriptional corepressor CYC8